MKRSNAAVRRICWLAIIAGLAIFSLSEFGAGRALASSPKEQISAKAITIVDQNGRPVPSARPSATSQIFDVTVGLNGTLQFTPDTLAISVGDTVRWTWSTGTHSSTSGTPGSPDGLWDSGIHTQGATFLHTFNAAGSFPYYCTPHGSCCGMVGTINVASACTPPPPNMVSWWPGDGNARDIQGGNNGVNNGTYAAGKVGQAFSLDGISHYVQLNNGFYNPFPATGFTYDAWIFPTDLSATRGVITNHQELGNWWNGVELSSGQVLLTLQNVSMDSKDRGQSTNLDKTK